MHETRPRTTPAVAAHYGSHPIAATRYGDVAPLQLPARPPIATLPSRRSGTRSGWLSAAQAVRDFPQLTVVINYPQ
ncbi:hypothetical protein B0H10DRAFT_2227833 [Mycena sp. CBHHK59/15]|nr:hypothetical protein B0H10DRAFT_2227833 [Mycena sp. CBHHK59/15]